MIAEACTTMFEERTLSAPAHLEGSSTHSIPPHDTSSTSPPSSLSSLEVRQEAQHPHISQLDGLKPQKDEISSSYFSTSNPINIPAEESILTLDPEYGNLESGSPLSSPTLRVCRHLQQHLNSQPLCSHSQIKRISDLVEEMVEETISTKSQCNVKEPSAPSAPPAPSITSGSSTGPSHIVVPPGLEADDNIQQDDAIDEGFCERNDEDGEEEFDTDALLATLRRTSAPAGLRRLYGHGKGAVFAPPRMRRKILKRKRRDQPDSGT